MLLIIVLTALSGYVMANLISVAGFIIFFFVLMLGLRSTGGNLVSLILLFTFCLCLLAALLTTIAAVSGNV